MPGGVVLPTVRTAADRDCQAYALEGVSADRVRNVHNLLMEKIFSRQTDVISIADLSDLLGAT
jgi:hypothetical protein